MTDDEQEPPEEKPDLHLVDASDEAKADPEPDDRPLRDDAVPPHVVWQMAFDELQPDAFDIDEVEDIASFVRGVYIAKAQNDPEFACNQARVAGFAQTCAQNKQVDLYDERRGRERKAPTIALDTQINASPSSDPHVQLELSDRRMSVRRALGLLPRVCGMISRLYYLNELEYNEITELTGMPIGTVKKQIVLGNRRLRHLLRPHAPESAKRKEQS